MGLPAEVTSVINAINQADTLDVIEVSDPYPNRDDSCLVRVYIEAHLRADSGTHP
jgi:hypothetical protein